MPLEVVTFCLAVNMYYEARSEPLKGQVAVNQVVQNRKEDPRFPDNECDVITQPGQFSWYWQGRDYFPLKETESWVQAAKLANLMATYSFQDITDGALYYHVKTEDCNHPGKIIGSHIFSKEYYGRH
jgi:spore germination cell wall hydrolase CwlJ-like protein